jgi:hypothetical protein
MMLRTTVAFVLALGLACAQDQDTAAKKLRIHVIGASLSGGFRDGPMTGATEKGDTVTMQQLLKPWCGDNARATTHGTLEMMAMFTNPDTIGEKQIQATVKAKPDAVVAIDFPFWFAYGFVQGDESKARSEHFAKGLAMLAQLEMPVVVGDLPDMHGAAERMLNPGQIPSAAVLKELNEQLAKFVVEHKNVHLVPLAEITKVMKTDGVALPLADGKLQTPPGSLLQGDRLHANRLGMAFLGFTLQGALRDLFPKDHPLHAQKWTLEQFIAACGAEGDLESLKAAKKPAEAGAGAGAGNGK